MSTPATPLEQAFADEENKTDEAAVEALQEPLLPPEVVPEAQGAFCLINGVDKAVSDVSDKGSRL